MSHIYCHIQVAPKVCTSTKSFVALDPLEVVDPTGFGGQFSVITCISEYQLVLGFRLLTVHISVKLLYHCWSVASFLFCH